MLANRRRLLAVQPEFLACLRADGNKAFTAARIGNTHHLASGTGHSIGIVTGNIAHQHHLGQAATFALGSVAHGFQVAVIQMLQPRQEHTCALGFSKHEVFDFNNAGHCIARVAKKLQAHRARVLGHLVHHPARAGNQAVSALFLNTRQATQKLVSHVLAQALFAECLAGNV